MVDERPGPAMTDAAVAAVLAEYRNRVYAIASRYAAMGDADQDDLAQEGLLAVWASLDTWDAAKASLSTWVLESAKRRIFAVATGSRPPTGGAPLDGPRSISEHGRARGHDTRRRIREFIDAHKRGNGGLPPTHAQIAAAVGISTGNVAYHMKRLYLTVEARVRIESLDAALDALGGPDGAPVDILAVTAIDPAEDDLAYHYGDIHGAVRHLPTDRDKEYVYRRFWQDEAEPNIADALGATRAAVATAWRVRIRPALATELGHLRDAA